MEGLRRMINLPIVPSALTAARSADESRPVLTYIHLIEWNKAQWFFAADGFQLSAMKADYTLPLALGAYVVVNWKATIEGEPVSQLAYAGTYDGTVPNLASLIPAGEPTLQKTALRLPQFGSAEAKTLYKWNLVCHFQFENGVMHYRGLVDIGMQDKRPGLYFNPIVLRWPALFIRAAQYHSNPSEPKPLALWNENQTRLSVVMPMRIQD